MKDSLKEALAKVIVRQMGCKNLRITVSPVTDTAHVFSEDEFNNKIYHRIEYNGGIKVTQLVLESYQKGNKKLQGSTYTLF